MDQLKPLRLAQDPVWSFRPDGSVRDLALPDPAEIDFLAMAATLSKIARFNGSSPRQPCGRAIICEISSTMREMGFAGETVSIETLKARGFPSAVVARFGDAAAAEARRASVRRIG